MLIIWALVISLAIIFKKKYRKFVLFSFIIAGTLFFTISEIGFKTAFIQKTGIRLRPYVTHSETIQSQGKKYSDSSFPSSHMVFTVAMITVLIFLFPMLRPYAILYAFLMAWSRMFNGMHYPSDVLAGTVLGIISGWLAVVVSKKIFLSK